MDPIVEATETQTNAQKGPGYVDNGAPGEPHVSPFGGLGGSQPVATPHDTIYPSPSTSLSSQSLRAPQTSVLSLLCNTFKQMGTAFRNGLNSPPDIAANVEALGAEGIFKPRPYDTDELYKLEAQKLQQGGGLNELKVPRSK